MTTYRTWGLDADRGEDWRGLAACSDRSLVHPEQFFPVGHGIPAKRQASKAASFCSGCPVIEPCGEWALTNRIEYGVWGGMTEDQRKRLIRRMAVSA